MPPNPERQARLAARRAQMAADPDLEAARQAASEAVLNSYQPQSTTTDSATPSREPDIKLFNWNKGGKVKAYSAGGAVNYYRAPGSFAEGGPPLPRLGAQKHGK